jgi:uncharacterized protein (DUF1684 family)
MIRPCPRESSALLVVAVPAVVAVLAGCASKPVDPDAGYRATLLAERAARDEAFRRQPGEPIARERFAELLPLNYFAPDLEFAVPASFEPASKPVAIQVPTSNGQTRQMEVVGALTFLLNGRQLSLDALVEAGAPQDRLFVPFTDLTSGLETYRAGRYLEIDRTATGIYVVDFNRAFNPYCYYNRDYDCPYPPARNRLPIPVRAGERLARSRLPESVR